MRSNELVIGYYIIGEPLSERVEAAGLKMTRKGNLQWTGAS